MGARRVRAELRGRVVELVNSGRKVAEAEADLGISDQTIYTWRRRTGSTVVSKQGGAAPSAPSSPQLESALRARDRPRCSIAGPRGG